MLSRIAPPRVVACLLFAVAGCHGPQPPGDPEPPASHLVAKLAEGCRLEGGPASSARLVGDDGGSFAPASELPRGARIEYRVPELGNAAPGSLSAEESELARYLQILFPETAGAVDYLRAVEGWPCVESVVLSPEVGLPADG